MKSHVNVLSDKHFWNKCQVSRGAVPLLEQAGFHLFIMKFIVLYSHILYFNLYNYSIWTLDIHSLFFRSSFNLCPQIHLIPRSSQHREVEKSGHRSQANLGAKPMSVPLGSEIIDKVFNFPELLCFNLRRGYSDVCGLN